MAKTILPEVTPTHEEIAAQAYEIYLREGSVPGRDLDHWLQAEVEVRQRTNGNGNGNGHHAETTTEPRSISKEPASAAPAQNPRAATPTRRTAKR
jgi:hypothetical protein